MISQELKAKLTRTAVKKQLEPRLASIDLQFTDYTFRPKASLRELLDHEKIAWVGKKGSLEQTTQNLASTISTLGDRVAIISDKCQFLYPVDVEHYKDAFLWLPEHDAAISAGKSLRTVAEEALAKLSPDRVAYGMMWRCADWELQNLAICQFIDRVRGYQLYDGGAVISANLRPHARLRRTDLPKDVHFTGKVQGITDDHGVMLYYPPFRSENSSIDESVRKASWAMNEKHDCPKEVYVGPIISQASGKSMPSSVLKASAFDLHAVAFTLAAEAYLKKQGYAMEHPFIRPTDADFAAADRLMHQSLVLSVDEDKYNLRCLKLNEVERLLYPCHAYKK